jgi:hypothetical protein
MGRTGHILAAALILLSVACAGLTAEQRAAAAKVQIITTIPALNCQNLGPVSGSGDSLRGHTVLLGGNTVQTGPDGTTAFYCPPLPQRLAPGTAPP